MKLVLCFHHHQPVGNLHWIFEDAFQKSYRPLLETIQRFSELRFALHYSGSLLDWLEQNHADFLDRLAELCCGGNVELLSGGYYEPILAAIPEADRVGQIRRMNNYLERRFSQRPSGLWLAERVWEPSLPRSLQESEIDYVVLDDSALLDKRCPAETSYLVTESEGRAVKVFLASEKLRYMLPYRPPEEVLAYFEEAHRANPNTTLVFADDAEKFGHWPGTESLIHQERWLDRFLGLLRDNGHWIECRTLRELARDGASGGLAYFPTSTYRELEFRSLPFHQARNYAQLASMLRSLPDRDGARNLLRGGMWHHFLQWCPEANELHKRMVALSKRLHRVSAVRGGGPEFQPAIEELFKAQCNETYWHYPETPHLRLATLGHLLRCEALLDKVEQDDEDWTSWEAADWDCDGREEVRIANRYWTAYLRPAEGGCLYELAWKPGALSLISTVTMRPGRFESLDFSTLFDLGSEDIVERVVQQEELTSLFARGYESYRRASLLDHFLEGATTAEDFAAGCYSEQADSIGHRYSYQQLGASGIALERDINLSGSGEAELRSAVRLQKRLELTHADWLNVEYLLEAKAASWQGKFAVEWNFGFSPEELGSVVEADATVARLVISGSPVLPRLTLQAEPAAEFWTIPRRLIQLTGHGITVIFQGLVTVAVWSVDFGERRNYRFKLSTFVGH